MVYFRLSLILVTLTFTSAQAFAVLTDPSCNALDAFSEELKVGAGDGGSYLPAPKRASMRLLKRSVWESAIEFLEEKSEISKTYAGTQLTDSVWSYEVIRCDAGYYEVTYRNGEIYYVELYSPVSAE